MKVISVIVKVGIFAAACWAGRFGLLILTCMPKKEKPLEGRKRIACIGDSITFGMGVNWTRSRDSYPKQLEKLLGEEYQVMNYGISSATLVRNGNPSYRKFDFLEHAKASKPEMFLLMLGTNDSKPEFWDAESYEKELEELVMELKEVDSCKKVYVMTPPAAFPKKGKTEVIYGIQDSVIKSSIGRIVKNVSEKCQAGFIDLYQVTENHPEYFKDGVHPNAKGNAVIAQAISKELKGE